MTLKKDRRIFSKEFRLSALERMIAGESPSVLARKPVVLRKSLYEWGRGLEGCQCAVR
jgi:hypothetical protein